MISKQKVCIIKYKISLPKGKNAERPPIKRTDGNLKLNGHKAFDRKDQIQAIVFLYAYAVLLWITAAMINNKESMREQPIAI